jgi:hypothetical protein
MTAALALRHSTASPAASEARFRNDQAHSPPIDNSPPRPAGNGCIVGRLAGYGAQVQEAVVMLETNDLVRAVKELAGIDRRKVRARFEERFTSDRMARTYETHYRRLFAAGKPAHPPVASEHLGTPASPFVP